MSIINNVRFNYSAIVVVVNVHLYINALFYVI